MTDLGFRVVGRFQILGGHTLMKFQIMTMKFVGIYTRNSKYWVGKYPCAYGPAGF